MTTEMAVVQFPIGSLRIVVDDGCVRRASFGVMHEPEQRDRFGVYDTMRAYFEGEVDAIDSLDARAAEGTAFQRAVWTQLRAIPVGETISYGELARRVGNPRASRAVGAANGSNPIGLIVPCHRVVRTGGALGGYAYGLEMKSWLLAHEAQHAPARRGTIFESTG